MIQDWQWTKLSLSMDVDGQPITADVKVAESAVEVTVTSPFSTSGFVEGCYRGGMAWAYECRSHPGRSFRMNGIITEAGLAVAKQLLTGLYLDWQVIGKNAGAVKEQVAEANRQLELLKSKFAEVEKPFREERSAIRTRFKLGELTQQEYQRKVKTCKKSMEEIDKERDLFSCQIRDKCETWLTTNCGRRVKFYKAVRILREMV